jgi:Fe-S-cluster-containing hydrogenase component 2
MKRRIRMEESNADKVVCKCGAIIPSKNIMINKAADSEGDEVIYVSTKCVKCWTKYKASFYGVLSLEDYENGTDLAIIRKAKKILRSKIDKESFINMCNCGTRIHEHLIEYSHPSIFEKDITVIKAKCNNCEAVHSTSKRIDIDKMTAIEIKEMLKEALQDKIYGKE